ncbi:unnamed protein product, partial [Heterosigma akashiwo]
PGGPPAGAGRAPAGPALLRVPAAAPGRRAGRLGLRGGRPRRRPGRGRRGGAGAR